MTKYIDAEALRKRLKDLSDWCRDGRKQGVDFVLDCILPDMPTADVQEVKHAKWIYCGVHFPKQNVYMCSLCGRYISANDNQCNTEEVLLYNFPYCNCGARMDGDEN